VGVGGDVWDGAHYYSECYVIGQACTTYGPRKLLVRSAKPQILFILLGFSDKNTL